MMFGLMIYSAIGYSQTSEIRIIANPSSSIIRLDTTLLKSNVPVQVKPGEYTLKMWSPKRRYFEQIVTVSLDSNVRIMKSLVFESEYLKDQKDLKKYKLKRFTSRFLPIPIFLGISVYNFMQLNKYGNEVDDNYNGAMEAQESYNNAVYIEDITASKNSFIHYQDAYDKSRGNLNRTRIITYSTLAVGTFISWHFLRKSRKLEKPVYQEKTLLSNIQFNYIEVDGINSVVLTCNF